MKRVVDTLGALVGLALAAPVLLATALVVRARLGSPVLFRQRRAGLHGYPFELYKFRTMKDLRDAKGELLPDAERLTSLGRFLRKTSLDELPELVNVLRGEMSLVGPRPLLPVYLERYSAEQARRHDVIPGVTGWAQIHGRNALTWDDRLALDVWYVDHHNLWLDFKILLRTLAIVLSRKGITQPGEATMQEFFGSAPARRDSGT